MPSPALGGPALIVSQPTTPIESPLVNRRTTPRERRDNPRRVADRSVAMRRQRSSGLGWLWLVLAIAGGVGGAAYYYSKRGFAPFAAAAADSTRPRPTPPPPAGQLRAAAPPRRRTPARRLARPGGLAAPPSGTAAAHRPPRPRPARHRAAPAAAPGRGGLPSRRSRATAAASAWSDCRAAPPC